MLLATAPGQTGVTEQSYEGPATSCHAIVTRRNDAEVLLLRWPGYLNIPVFDIPQRQRVAPHLLPAIRARLGVSAVCRFSLPLTSSDLGGRCVVLEALGEEPIPEPAAWIRMQDIEWNRIEPAVVREILWTALAKATAYDTGQVAGPFARAGWLEDVLSWVRSRLANHGTELRGTWTQYNMGPGFSLIRLDTDKGGIWFKAVSERNLREFSITRRLAELDLPHVSPLLAVSEDWHAWLMPEAEGAFLDERAPETLWKASARCLAELQIASVSHSQNLIGAGCQDLRTTILKDTVEPFLSGIASLIQRQPVIPPRRLDTSDLRLIERSVIAACQELEVLGIPDTLGHSDLNSCNVLVGSGGSVFLDWMQGHVGNPLITFEYLSALRRRLVPGGAVDRVLRDEYLSAWRCYCPDPKLEQALRLIPLLAPFAYGLTLLDFHTSVDHVRPELAALLRSLARRMYAEAERIEGQSKNSTGPLGSLNLQAAGSTSPGNPRSSDPDAFGPGNSNERR